MNDEYGNNDFDDPLRCPQCGMKMPVYMDTPVCIKCDPLNVTYLTWLKDQTKEMK
jgi:hypothetical protein